MVADLSNGLREPYEVRPVVCIGEHEGVRSVLEKYFDDTLAEDVALFMADAHVFSTGSAQLDARLFWGNGDLSAFWLSRV